MNVESTLLPQTNLRPYRPAAQKRVHNRGGVVEYRKLVARPDFDKRVEGRGRLPFENCLLRPAASSFFITQRHRMYSAKKVGQRGIHQKIVERVSMCGGNQLHTPLCNRARRLRFGFGADFVDNDHLGGVILHGFDHHGVLEVRARHLHAAARADARMRNVAIAGDLIGCVDDDHTLAQFRGEHPGAFPQQGRFSDSGTAQQQDTFARFNDVPQHIHGAVDRAPDTTGQTDHNIPAIAYAGDPMERSFDSGAIVLSERTHAMGCVFEILTGDGLVAEIKRAIRKMCLRLPSEIHNDLNEILQVGLPGKRIFQVGRHDTEQEIEIVGDFLAWQFAAPRCRAICYPKLLLPGPRGTGLPRSSNVQQKGPVVL